MDFDDAENDTSELNAKLERLETQLCDVTAERDVLRAALAFYADEAAWQERNLGEWAWHRKREASPSLADADGGAKARAALAAQREGS